MLADKHDKSGYGEQSGQGMADFPLRPIHRPIGWKGIDRPSIDRLVHWLVERKEVYEHCRVTECRDEAGSARVTISPSHKKQGDSRNKREDFHRPECLSPTAIKVLLNAEPQNTIEFELRDHLKRMRHRRGSSNEGEDQINNSQGTHPTS